MRPVGSGHPGGGAGDLRRRIVFRSIAYMVSRALSGGLGALASLMLFRFLGPSEAGLFSVTLATTMTLGTLGGLGLHDMLARFAPERPPEEAAGIFVRSLRMIGGASAIWIALFAVLVWRRLLVPPEIIGIAPVFVAGTVVYSVYATSVGMFRGQGRLPVIPRLDFGANFMAKITALGVVLLTPGFAAAFTAHTGVQLLVTGVALYLLRKPLRAGSLPLNRTESVYARFVLLGDLVRVLVNTVNLYVLGILLAPTDVGIFAAGSRFIRMVELLVLSPMAAPLLYYFSHPDSSHMKERIVARGSRVAGTVMGLAALVLALLAGPIVKVFLGAEYLESIPVARMYASHALGAGILILFIPFYSSVNRPQYSIMQGVLTFSMNLGLDLVLVPRYGAAGAAAASVAAIFTTVLAATLFIGRRFSIRILGGTLRLLALYGVSFLLLQTGHPVPAFLVYLGGVVPLGLLRREDLELFRRRGNRT